MDTFKLISEHYSPSSDTFLMVGENNGRYEVRDAKDEPFTLYGTFDEFWEAHAFAEKEVETN